MARIKAHLKQTKATQKRRISDMEKIPVQSRYNGLRFRKKLYAIANIAAFAVFASLMAVAAFYDLQISMAIGDQDNLFGLFFEVIGEWPSYLVLPFVAPVIFYNADQFPDKRARYAFRAIGMILSWLGYFMWIYAGTKPAMIEIPGILMFAVFGGFAGGAFGLWVGSLIKRETMNRLLKFALFALVYMVVALLVMQGLKMLWGRMRYREMLKTGSTEGFTPWYVINIGNGEDSFKSFPSGHTSSAATIFVLAVLCDIFPSLDNIKARVAINVSCVLFVVLVALSRIVNCAHFLSDTLVGGYLTYVIFAVLRRIFFGKGRYVYTFRVKKEVNDVEQETL